MKGKDLFVIGGIGLALYLLMPKAKEAVAAGGVTTVIPMPTGAHAGALPTPALDIGGLVGGMAEMFTGVLGAMPTQLVPEINIPEFILPPIVIPEVPGLPDFPDWSQFIPDWSQFIPDWESFIPDIPDEGIILDIPNLIPDILDLPDLIPDLIPDLFGGNGKGNGDGAFMGFVDEVVVAWDKTWGAATDVVAWGNRPWYELFLDPLWLKKETTDELEIRLETEAIFEEAGFSEITPKNIDVFVKARETITGEKAEILPAIGTEAYMLRMMGNPKPYVRVK